jgi:hypothetical protein
MDQWCSSVRSRRLTLSSGSRNSSAKPRASSLLGPHISLLLDFRFVSTDKRSFFRTQISLVRDCICTGLCFSSSMVLFAAHARPLTRSLFQEVSRIFIRRFITSMALVCPSLGNNTSFNPARSLSSRSLFHRYFENASNKALIRSACAASNWPLNSERTCPISLVWRALPHTRHGLNLLEFLLRQLRP